MNESEAYMGIGDFNEQRIKIGYVAHRAVSLAGGELSLLALMSGVPAYGFEPVLICDEECPLTEKARGQGIKVEIIPAKMYTYTRSVVTSKAFFMYPIKRIYNLMLHGRMKSFLLSEGIKLLHFNSSVVCHEWANVSRKLEIPYVWHFREFMDKDHDAVVIGKRYFESLLKNANRRIAISKSVQSNWTKKLGRSCDLVYNGLRSEDYYQEHEILNEEDINCVIIARVVEGKGQLEAVQAIHDLVKSGMRNVKLTIVGFRFMEGSLYEKQILAYINDNNLEDYIKLVEFTPDIKSIHMEHDIGLICSRAEAFGRITIEYMMGGLLAVGTNTGGTPELINDGITGMLYEQGNHLDLAEKLRWIAQNKERARNMAKTAQKNAVETFSIEKTVHGVSMIYDEVLNKSCECGR